ncbi:MAG: hypothetical protein AB1486_17365 [Planctomycetota bacterium]
MGGTSDGAAFHVDPQTGRFRLGPFPPGRYEVGGFAPGFAKVVFEEVTLESHETLDIGIHYLLAPSRLTATLRRTDGKPRGKVWLQVRNLDRHGPYFIEREGESARSNPLPLGRYSLWVRGQEIASRDIPFTIEPERDTHLDVILEAGVQCSIRCLEPPNVKPARGIYLRVRNAEGALLFVDTSPRQGDGELRGYAQLAPGTYTIKAETDTGLKGNATITIPDLVPPEGPFVITLQ